ASWVITIIGKPYLLPTWSRQIEFTLAGIGSAVGLGNVWRFPYLCYRSGGGAFLVPYLLMLVVLGIPLLHMELIMGQFTRRGPVHALAYACPLLKGVGMATVAISFIMCTYYNVVITWALYYLFSSFQDPLPWQNCNNTWNTPNCTSHATNSSYTSTASQEFFKYKMLKPTSGVEEAGQIRWPLFLILLLSWILIYLCIFKGVKSTGKVVYFTALFPYVILIALLINNVQLPGALDGITFFIVPDWKKLLVVEVWVNAAAQIFNSIGIGFGSLMAMSSYNSFHNNIIKDTLSISVINSFTSILAGFVIFSVGIYVFQLMDHYTAIVSIMFLAFFEVMAICANRLSDNLEAMTGKKANIFFRLCWLIIVILIFSVIQFKPARYEEYIFPPWAQGVGWVIAMASIIWIPLGAVHTLWVLPGSLVQKLKLSLTPTCLEETSKIPYYERGGVDKHPAVAVVSSNFPASEKSPIQTNL
uniref:Transporter n=1 Tax=Cynoglossus semilaevis TaxID=244447 RepID=A0A3P8WF38_CYNSE